MRVIESCAECLYDKQLHRSGNKEFLEEVERIIRNRKEDDTSPYLVYLFNQAFEKYVGRVDSYKDVKKQYNDLVLSMEDSVRRKIEEAADPLIKSLLYSRIGNYIDFGAMNNVDEETFLSLLDEAAITESDIEVMESFIKQCENAEKFLLITDNCGEIVLDKLFLEQLGKRCPQLSVSILVRGREVLNDATSEDAEYVGLNKWGKIYSNGYAIGGSVYEMLSEETKKVMDEADVILAKGQGNYESMNGQGMHVFYSFLCKCDLFTSRFKVPRLTGIFIEERGGVCD